MAAVVYRRQVPLKVTDGQAGAGGLEQTASIPRRSVGVLRTYGLAFTSAGLLGQNGVRKQGSESGVLQHGMQVREAKLGLLDREDE